MSDSLRALDAGAVERLQDAYDTWTSRPFSLEFPEALARRVMECRSRRALLTMLREDDVDVALEAARTPRQERWVFACLWRSGLFDGARKLLANAPELRRAVGLDRPTRTELGLPPPVYTDDTITAFRASEQLSRWGLWGESKPARRLHNAVARVARDTRRPVEILNVGIGGPSGSEKAAVALAIHIKARRGPFCALGPGHEEPDPALAAAMSGGTLYLWGCDHLQEKVRSSVYAALAQTTPSYRGTEMDTLLIVDSPKTRVQGYGSGEHLGAGEGLAGTLGKKTSGQWSFFSISPLQRRITDVPLLVNKTLERLRVDGLADIRHHLACWLWEEIERSTDILEAGWLDHAVTEVCEVLCPDWSPPPGNAVDAAPDDTKVDGRQSEEAPPSLAHSETDDDADTDTHHVLRRTSAGWAVTFSGTLVTIATDSNGMLAIAYLLSVGRPPNGARDVAAAMDSGAFDPPDTDQHQTGVTAVPSSKRQGRTVEQQTVHQLKDQMADAIGAERAIDQMTPEQARLYAQQVREELADIDEELGSEETGRERREELSEQKEKINRHLSASVNVHGESHQWGRKEPRRVGNAINRALDAIDKHAERARDAEGKALMALHRHLKSHIKYPHRDDMRYEPPDGTRWTVETKM